MKLVYRIGKLRLRTVDIGEDESKRPDEQRGEPPGERQEDQGHKGLDNHVSEYKGQSNEGEKQDQ